MNTRFGDAVSEAITQGMAAYAAEHGLPALHWSLRYVQGPALVAHAGRADYADHERVNAAELWASHLGFTDADKVEYDAGPMRYTIEWRGVVEDYPVILWAITDEDAWDEVAARGLPYVRDQQE